MKSKKKYKNSYHSFVLLDIIYYTILNSNSLNFSKKENLFLAHVLEIISMDMDIEFEST